MGRSHERAHRRDRRRPRAGPRRGRRRRPPASGSVELHTDHIEAHYVPRPKVYWDPVAAVVSYDGQLATCGITTVMDSLRVWRDEAEGDVLMMANILADAIGKARCANLLRADHFLHLRCE